MQCFLHPDLRGINGSAIPQQQILIDQICSFYVFAPVGNYLFCIPRTQPNVHVVVTVRIEVVSCQPCKLATQVAFTGLKDLVAFRISSGP